MAIIMDVQIKRLIVLLMSLSLIPNGARYKFIIMSNLSSYYSYFILFGNLSFRSLLRSGTKQIIYFGLYAKYFSQQEQADTRQSLSA